ncbi:uncharacterized protein TRIVIDRAFT_55553 [Trichoderma virens Gv29-8]|uniref:Zn(2)-C6 fungal-type domain-containing protein n=1 Tax=Hypocrea virens (strain Gv29-8 / FGSC 10586) TaxID=413071 RepID=G9MHH2_HYPVG|nr:uncharacterized protein TRIVIDRAFT_55553 [Trichoderma virens Gv29-8]EHK26160.1 hypothetical protein TRIVIDRAFT_55553 [Trichoderma virens Gv29-8]UKZ46347.1 hypothetical protein TrVGV298_000548 [Trichoderma virens]
MFGQYTLDGIPADGTYRVPKLNHKKSRFGCQRCRTRRVKCNEAKPTCQHCERHRAKCIYDRLPQKRTSQETSPGSSSQPLASESGVSETSPDKPSPLSSVDPLDEEVLESKQRRLLETRLMHLYVTETGPSLPIDEKTYKVFATLAPKLALDSEALLYAIYALAAIHSLICNIDDSFDGLNVHRRYLTMAVHEHQKEILELNESNFEVVCLTSHLLRVCTFATLRYRAREPYTPPLEWILITATTQALFTKAWGIILAHPESIVAGMMRSSPIIYDLQLRYSEANRRGLEYMLERDAEDVVSEPWDMEIQDAYETTLSYIGGILLLVHSKDANIDPGDARRRLVIFPMAVKKKFLDLMQEVRPRAMVIMAYYFSMLVIEKLWWVGDVGKLEVQSIAANLPAKWQKMMDWPLRVVETGTILPI